jgi:hypothetical protein
MASQPASHSHTYMFDMIDGDIKIYMLMARNKHVLRSVHNIFHMPKNIIDKKETESNSQN